MTTTHSLLEDLFAAYWDARRHKRTTRSQLGFELDLEHNLMRLYEEVRDRTYRLSPCVCFICPEPVRREIFSTSFPGQGGAAPAVQLCGADL